ncbi:VWA domain-containing protein [Quisquiliibacterium transsilvanicum]|uniref:Ca-activated chloride channel family protein n=1 Tax=Quisquiliibacterium transsilvanicum TaxID=1549638 RepID=A0A7W8MAT1_9BURK|nr:VWA domain-containing protein [Quisquiliibacterium transsilvanicum]MBB5273655.1 Ca-activated chloride channel family protein [Quisquiliibacterium transsilvanicum]
MEFGWPALLWLLVLAPAPVLANVVAARRRRRAAAAGATQAPAPPVRAWRRAMPALLLSLALAALLVAAARPSAQLSLPAPHEVVVLAIDISGSMRAADIAPDRIGAARAAAREFVLRQPATTRIGLVAFAASASLVQTPTHDRDAVLAALDRLQLQQATAVGSGLLVALKAIDPALRFDLRAEDPRADPENWPAPIPPGSNRSAAIVLLSDGESGAGPEPELAARIAAQRGVRVYTVGLGTAKGAVLAVEGWSMRVRLDEAGLRRIAELTLGEYFPAASAAELTRVYRALDLKLGFERRRVELSGALSAAAALLLALSAGLSLAWFKRVF